MSTRCQVSMHTCNIGQTFKDGKTGKTITITVDWLLGRLAKDRNGSVLLYHHYDGYPSSQLVKIAKFLDEIDARLKTLGFPYWWDNERVAALMVALSACHSDPELLSERRFKRATQAARDAEMAKPGRMLSLPPSGYPMYQPSGRLHGDVEWLYDVFLIPGELMPPKDEMVKGRHYTPEELAACIPYHDKNNYEIVAHKVRWSRRKRWIARLVEVGRYSSIRNASDKIADVAEAMESKSEE